MRKLLTMLYFLVPTLWISTGVTAAPGVGGASSSGGHGADSMAGYHKIWEGRLPVTGKSISSPALRWKSAETYRVQVTGVLDTRKLGAKYDAQFRSISAREFRVRHEHLRFGSSSWVGMYAHHREHRYVYRLDPQATKRPANLRLSLDGIPYQFRISPSRLQRESTSTLRVSLWKKGAASHSRRGFRWDFAGLGAGLALVLALIVWWRRRRKA